MKSAPEGEVYDRFRGRIMFPICNDVGEVIAFSGRVLEKDAETAKYLNSPETPLFRKGRVLFGLHKTKRGADRSGLRDRLRRPARSDHAVRGGDHECGRAAGDGVHREAGADLEAVRERSGALFRRRRRRAKGGGAFAGRASCKTISSCASRKCRPGEDPDSMVRNKGAEEFEKRIAAARDFFDYWIEREAARRTWIRSARKCSWRASWRRPSAGCRTRSCAAKWSNKVSARLGVPRADFETLLRNRAASGSPTRGRSAPRAGAAARGMRSPCFACSRCATRRRASFSWRRTGARCSPQTPDAEMLGRDSGERSASGRSGIAECLHGRACARRRRRWSRPWLLQKMPPNALDGGAGLVERACARPRLRRQLQIAEGRMKLPQSDHRRSGQFAETNS